MSLGAALYIVTAITLIALQKKVLERWGDYTLACLILRQHEWCSQHLSCECPHHDEIIHQEMSK